jgi:Fe-S cluster assembly protein SufD
MSTIITDTASNRIANFVSAKTNVQAGERATAFEAFKKNGLPGPKSEEYKYTPIARILEKNFTFTPSPASAPIHDINEFFIKGFDKNRVVFIDGVYSKDFSSVNIPGVSVENLGNAFSAKNETVLKHLSSLANNHGDALTSWNTAAWTHGVFVNVPDNTNIDEPIVIYHIANATAGEIIAVNRNLFAIGKNSQVTIVEKFDSTGDANHFLNLVSEVVVDENGGLEYYSIQNDNNNRFQHSLTEIHQKNSSRVNTYSFTLNGKFYRNNLHLSLDGEGIESHMYGLYLLSGDTLGDNHTVVDHKKANSYSNELYKGIMDDSSRGVFNGKIFVRPNAQKTNAFQANRNILLSDKATINTKPQLEIWADDVKCSHGCTTGQLDEEALFYLQSRGINKDTARAMMLYAFAGELIEKIKNPLIREYMDHVISERLHKNF